MIQRKLDHSVLSAATAEIDRNLSTTSRKFE